MKLWDVRNWEVFEGLQTMSLQLTADSKYFTITGDSGDYCVVLEIKRAFLCCTTL